MKKTLGRDTSFIPVKMNVALSPKPSMIVAPTTLVDNQMLPLHKILCMAQLLL